MGDMMILNMKLEGFPEEILNEMVHKGIASNKTEAIRLMILDYNKQYGIKKMDEYLEDQAIIKKIKTMEKEVKEGKRKVLNEEDVLKKYPHLRDV